MFCAATLMRVPREESITFVRVVNGAQITTSAMSSPAICGSSAKTKSSASKPVLFIFQLPAMYGRRGDEFSLLIVQGLHSGQFFALDQFQGRTATGRKVRYIIREPELRDRCGGVSPADHSHALGVGH